MVTGNETRKSFLEFFKSKGHPILPSSSLIPQGDPTLLFIAAGMAPLKPYFMGLKTDLKRAASCQKSLRTTDIDRVGTTIRHLTFFEMLGNFSFGDYFKEDSIAWGWEYLTKTLKLDPARLYVTVYGGGIAPADQDAEKIWEKVLPSNLRAGRIKALGDDSNFWTMGDTGPCGPCSEIYYDFGPEFHHPGCFGVGCNCDRYIEIWNHVFTQFDRQADGSLKMLPRKNIDTGMGLERLSIILQGKATPFETDLFLPVTNHAMDLLKINATDVQKYKLELRVISDHARACTMLVSEGITPSNEGRGYILRRLIRRAVRYGKLSGRKEPFMHLLAPSVASIFGDIYPELGRTMPQLQEAIRCEEERFLETLESGEKHLSALLERSGSEIPGSEAFHLYETYGFPLELTSEIAGRMNKTVDEKGFNEAKSKAQQTAKAKWKGSGQKEGFSFHQADDKFPATVFTGYSSLREESSVVGLMDGDGQVSGNIVSGAEGYVALDVTPFYAESGGQVGDKGALLAGGKPVAEVLDTQRPVEKVVLHRVKALAELRPGMKVSASVSVRDRKACAANHTAVHLINEALRRVLGSGVRQAGSYVSPERFRFDYTCNAAPSKEQLDRVEEIANEAVRACYQVLKEERPLKDAEKMGAVTLLGEKYKDPARFVLINDKGWDSPKERYSLELCGGTHADGTGELILVRVIKDSALSSGVRRIEGVAGISAVEYLSQLAAMTENLSRKLLSSPDKLEERIAQLVQNEKDARQEIHNLKQKLMGGQAGSSFETVPLKDGVSLVYAMPEGADPKMLRSFSDQLREKHKKSVIFVGAANGDKLSFVVASGGELGGSVDAGALAKSIGARLEGKAGGRADFAQGGGKMPNDMKLFIKDVAEELKGKLK